MGQCTLRTDLIPGVGPSGDQLYPVALRPLRHASQAGCLASVCAQSGRRELGTVCNTFLITPGPRGPNLAVRRAPEEAGERADAPTDPASALWTREALGLNVERITLNPPPPTLRIALYAYPCEREGFLWPMREQAAASSSSSPSPSSKVSPLGRMPLTAAPQLKQFPCPASRAATLSWPPSPPLAPRLPALHVRHSHARDARPVPGSARDSDRSPSAI